MARSVPRDFASARTDWWWVFDPRYSLRARAVLLVGGLGLIFTIVVTLIADAVFHRELENQLGTSFDLLAVQLSDKLDRAVYANVAQLQLTAGLARFRSADTPLAERRRLLQALQNATPDLAWAGFIDPAGRVSAATQQLPEGESAAVRPWFTTAVERGFTAGLDAWPALGRALARPERDDEPARFLMLAVPVTGASGEFLGVLAAQLNWDWAREVQASVIPEAARQLHLGATVYAGVADVIVDTGSSGWTRPPNAPDLPGTRRLHGALLEKSSVGTDYITGYARSLGYRDYRGVGWLVTVRQPVAFAFAPVGRLQRSIARWAALLLVAGVGASWFFAGQLARRLRSVAAAARRIRTGDRLTVMPGVRGGIEVDEMCGAVSELVEELRRQRDAALPDQLGTEPHLKSRPPSDQIHRLV